VFVISIYLPLGEMLNELGLEAHAKCSNGIIPSSALILFTENKIAMRLILEKIFLEIEFLNIIIKSFK
tara:strand:+ start:403 stop:606 length:204 start_codon:yes stop_codon:yes gene_type:complete